MDQLFVYVEQNFTQLKFEKNGKILCGIAISSETGVKIIAELKKCGV